MKNKRERKRVNTTFFNNPINQRFMQLYLLFLSFSLTCFTFRCRTFHFPKTIVLKLSKTLIFNMVYLGFPTKEKGQGTNGGQIYCKQVYTKCKCVLKRY